MNKKNIIWFFLGLSSIFNKQVICITCYSCLGCPSDFNGESKQCENACLIGNFANGTVVQGCKSDLIGNNFKDSKTCFTDRCNKKETVNETNSNISNEIESNCLQFLFMICLSILARKIFD